MFHNAKGKTIWSRNRGSKGVIQNVTQRFCISCAEYHTCYTVYWDDGNITYPLTDGVMVNHNGEFEII